VVKPVTVTGVLTSRPNDGAGASRLCAGGAVINRHVPVNAVPEATVPLTVKTDGGGRLPPLPPHAESH